MAKKPAKGELGITSEEALQFIRKMQTAFPKPPRTQKDRDRLQKYLAKFTDRELKAVGHRVQSDLMLRPPRTIAPKSGKGEYDNVSASGQRLGARRSRRAARGPRRGGRGRG